MSLWPLGYSTEVPYGTSPQPHQNLSYSSDIADQAGKELTTETDEGPEDIVPDLFHDNDSVASDPDDPDYTFPQSDQSSGSSDEESNDVLGLHLLVKKKVVMFCWIGLHRLMSKMKLL